ncbi:MAG: tRNA (adenosine(37)-N6)-threonylcarbamoyltransferase complex ATPase subunit type 1 TsaE [Endomicrobium sp.]|jgi:tRNA threonylcarbamoyladenosine biosynthesis protein TsaE|nr:tRNA (adenosine(37)-N6)-threonylcarbamoyltransferase complex ATPase subunit type 1 TsaE [Endomicrobium sp.]
MKNKKLNISDINIFKKKTFITKTPKETRELGKKFAAFLKKGDIVLLRGDLGAGKTTFVQGIMQAFRSRVFVNSSSFSIINEYDVNNGIKLFHIDLYRLQSLNSVFDIGIEEYIYSNNISCIEWPDRLACIQNDCQWSIEIENIGLVKNIRISKK